MSDYGVWVPYPLDQGDKRPCWLYEYRKWGPGVFVINETWRHPDAEKSICTWDIRSGASFAGARLAHGTEIGVENTKRIALEALQKLRAGWIPERDQ
jgi:hypothetical protein